MQALLCFGGATAGANVGTCFIMVNAGNVRAQKISASSAEREKNQIGSSGISALPLEFEW